MLSLLHSVCLLFPLLFEEHLCGHFMCVCGHPFLYVCRYKNQMCTYVNMFVCVYIYIFLSIFFDPYLQFMLHRKKHGREIRTICECFHNICYLA